MAAKDFQFTNRVRYEAFARFSTTLTACTQLAEVGNCIAIHLKYLFNYYGFRLLYQYNSSRSICIRSTYANTSIDDLFAEDLLQWEEVLQRKGTPVFSGGISAADLATMEITTEQEEDFQLWAWKFENAASHSLVSVVSGNLFHFQHADIVFLRLVVENVMSKLYTICLLNELKEKNEFISEIMTNQESIIKEKTREISAKNKALMQLSVMNAHTVREPLTRIKGLMLLMDDEATDKDEFNEIMWRLKVSANDLDNALQKVIEQTSNELIELKDKDA